MTALLGSLGPRGALGGLDFELPQDLEATEPPEARGLRRDEVRLLVAWRHRQEVEHAAFRDLPRFLEAGDLLVVNTSGTLPAAVDAMGPNGEPLELHLSTRLPAELWVIELRQPGLPASSPYRDAAAGASFSLPGGGVAELLVPYGTPGRLWVASLHLPAPLESWLAEHGRAIRYRYVPADWPIVCYQTVFATEPGSAEMPSAARPFTTEVVADLVKRGIGIAPLLLHTGVSCLEAHERPYPEYYRVPVTTARLVNHIRRDGGRVIAVGTTAVRALETVADDRGIVHPGEGWTETVISPERGVRVVDGLITGWHEPAASHLALLETIAGRSLLECSYAEALAARYRWHEFGDSHLILP
ncbi:MAG TPA: S-adenosylmethionine:tRNA ribosyltransferase-isomerase [Acidimicrobiales bacterium]|nr:S-adenosylmethionine:tRNA ribosyltransferase-isomerase [Acidimicrobiales bacterium]